jgi:hypothetical protein
MSHWKYKNTALLIVSICVAFWLSQYEPFHQFLLGLGQLGYIGAFLAGFLFVSSFTVVTGAVILLVLAEQLSLLELGIIAGLGSVAGDLTIFRFVKDSLISEVGPIYNKFGGKHLTSILHSKYFSWTLPLLGALIIASPLPDEIGVSLMGLSKMKTYQFIVLSFVLNAIGISLVISTAHFIKP